MSYDLIHKAVEPTKVGKAARQLLDSVLASGFYYLQPKYDGVNAVLDITKGDGVTGYRLRTRTGEDIKSCLHIIGTAANAKLPAGRYFGEVWHPTHKHHVISGLARQHDHAPDLVFMAFDYLSPYAVAAGFTDHAYLSRYGELREIMSYVGGDAARTLQLADMYPTPGPTTLDTLIDRTPDMLYALRQRGGDYDGLMLRPWAYGLVLGASGSDGALVKLKPRATADLLVVGTYPGKGKHLGRTGGLIVSLDGNPNGSDFCEVGTGLSDAERALGFHWVGKIVEVTYLELTKAKKLREPAFIGIRTDKNQPDNLLGE